MPSTGCGLAPADQPGQTAERDILVDALARSYRLHLPAGYHTDTPTPLLLAFHGYTGTSASAEKSMQFSPHADEHGYIAVYPQATFFDSAGTVITSWNDLACNASPGPAGPICAADAYPYPFPPECGTPDHCNWCTCHDDLAFVAALLDSLENTLCIDLDRVYATGMSNGGMLAHRLGCAMSDRFAAIAPVAGTLAKGFNCAPELPISLMHIHGDNDIYVRVDGKQSSDGYLYEAIDDVVGKWADKTSQHCATQTTPYPTSADGIKSMRCEQRADCATGAEVVSCGWQGGHVWPAFGRDVIWNFFNRHSRGDDALPRIDSPVPP
jgi:polyhydroxybutyrate depolymerase